MLLQYWIPLEEPELTVRHNIRAKKSQQPVTNRNESPNTDDPTDHLVPAASATTECPMKVAYE